MKHFLRSILLVHLLGALSAGSMIATTITTTGSGNWSSTISDAPWPGGVLPGSGDDVVIADGHTVTIDQNVTVVNLTVGQGTGGKLYFDGTARTLALNGDLTIGTGGSFVVYNVPTTIGDVSIGSAVVTNIPSTAGMVVGTSVTGTGLDPLATIVSIDNANTVTLSLPATATATGVVLSIKPTGTLTASSNVITNVTSTAGVAFGMTVGATGLSGATVATSDATTITLSVAATISGTLVPLTIRPAATHSITLAGNIVNNGTLDWSLSSTLNTLATFTKAGNQTIGGTAPTITRFRSIVLNKTARANKVICSLDASCSGSTAMTFTAGTWEQTAGILYQTSGSLTVGATSAAPIWGLTFSGSGGYSGTSNLTNNGFLEVNTTGIIELTGSGGHGTIGVGKIDCGAGAGFTSTSNFTQGTINIPKFNAPANAIVNMTGANFNIDPQLLTATETAFSFNSATIGTLSAGTVTILNPIVLQNAAGIEINTAALTTMSGTFTFVLGQGASTISTAAGFRIKANSAKSYNNLIINAGSSGLTLLSNIVAAGKATFISNGTLSFNGFAFRYGVTGGTPTGTLEYNGTSQQTVSDFDWPTGTQYRPVNVIFNNPAGVVLAADRTVPATLAISNGTLADGGFTLTVNGNIVNNATHSGTGKIRLFGGTASHTLSGAGTYGNLEVFDTFGASLSGNTVVNGTLTLTAGTLTNGAFLTFGNSAFIIRISGNLTATPTFGSTVNLTYGKTNASTCSITIGTNQLTMGTIYPLGFLITSPELPANTTIVSTSGSVATLSNLAIATATAVSMSITWPNSITSSFELPTSSSALGNLTINNAAGAVLNGSATVNGTLTLTSGTLVVGANTLGLNGPAIAGTPANLSTTSASSISFGGSSSGVTIPSIVTALNNLTINNSSGVTLGGSMTCDGSVSVTSGDLDLNGNTLTLGPSAMLSETAGNTVIGTTGVITTTRSLNAPAGADIAGMGISITSAANLGSTVITRGHAAQTNGTNFGIKRYFDITPTNNSELNATLNLHFDDSELNGVSPSNIYVFKSMDAGATWVGVPGLVFPNNIISVGGQGDLSRWTVGDFAAPLPIQLASFTAIVVERGAVRLDWTTISEVNNYGFYVQRRNSNETTWQRVSVNIIPGSGTTNTPHRYSFVDNTPSERTIHYRLEQVDLDGTVHFTEPIEVTGVTSVVETAPMAFALKQNYPNPFNPSTEVKFSVEKTAKATLEIFNVIGQKVATLFEDVAEAGRYYQVRLDAKNLSSGTYLYRLQSGEKIQIKRMLLLK